MKLRKLAGVVAGFVATVSVATAAVDPLVAAAEQKATQSKAASAALNPDIKEALARFSELNWVQILPVEDLIMVENQNGEHILMDTNSRIAIRGQVEVYDLWNKRPIKTKADAHGSWLVSLDKFNIKPGDLASYRYGLDKELPDITLLVDPRGDYNKQLFDQVKALADQYSFEIVLLPLMGDESIMQSLQLWCAKDQEKSLKTLMDQEQPSDQVFPTCDKDPLIRAIGLGGILKVKGLPYLIRADGLQNTGAPESLAAFMAKDASSLGEVKVNEDVPVK